MKLQFQICLDNEIWECETCCKKNENAGRHKKLKRHTHRKGGIHPELFLVDYLFYFPQFS